MSGPGQIRCGSCQGQALTEPLKIHANGYGFRVESPLAKPGWMSDKHSVHMQARICLGCGFVGLYAQPESLEELRANRPSST